VIGVIQSLNLYSYEFKMAEKYNNSETKSLTRDLRRGKESVFWAKSQKGPTAGSLTTKIILDR